MPSQGMTTKCLWQLTTDGVVTVVMNFQYDDEAGNSYNTDGLTITFPEETWAV